SAPADSSATRVATAAGTFATPRAGVVGSTAGGSGASGAGSGTSTRIERLRRAWLMLRAAAETRARATHLQAAVTIGQRAPDVSLTHPATGAATVRTPAISTVYSAVSGGRDRTAPSAVVMSTSAASPTGIMSNVNHPYSGMFAAIVASTPKAAVARTAT